MSGSRQHAHDLIDRLPEAQVSALVGLLEAIVVPVTTALHNAPVDDEPETEADHRAVAESREWLKQKGKGVVHDEAMRSLGY